VIDHPAAAGDRIFRLLMSAALVALGASPAQAWGPLVHQRVTSEAIDTLPKGLKPFYKAHRLEMPSLAVDTPPPGRRPARSRRLVAVFRLRASGAECEYGDGERRADAARALARARGVHGKGGHLQPVRLVEGLETLGQGVDGLAGHPLVDERAPGLRGEAPSATSAADMSSRKIRSPAAAG